MVYVFLANGFEEVEALAVVDILRRGELDVSIVGVDGICVTGSHNIKVVCDCQLSGDLSFDNLDMIVLPGGMPGTLNLEKNQLLQQIIDDCVECNIKVAAICAAPSILGRKGLLNGVDAVCYVGFEDQLLGANLLPNQRVCVDGNFITAIAAGASFEFGLTLLQILKGDFVCEKVRQSMFIS